jgi:sugar O-acyltransferase (sialic acid O-acetyltransferase NeuD family)
MVIIGTGGLAKDVIASMEQDLNSLAKNIWFFNNAGCLDEKLFDFYPILTDFEQLIEHFEKGDNKFITCIGNPLMRKRITEKVEGLGGHLIDFVSQKTCAISPLTAIDKGVVIQQGCIVSRNAILKKGVFINASVVIGHDVFVDEYVSIGPGAKILGNAEIGQFSYIGTNAVIMPGVKIGKKVRIGVGKIIEENIPDNSKIL